MGREIELIFNDGHKQTVQLVRPKRSILWKHGRTARMFSHKVEQIANGEKEADIEEQGLVLLESMSEAEADKFQAFADDVVRNSTVPKINPEDLTEISYWQVFGHVFYAIPNSAVETSEGDTTLESVENFHPESELSVVSTAVQDVPQASV